jgi:hypothetical protein
VAWNNRSGSAHKTGGAHSFFDGLSREPSSQAIPTIWNGIDVQSIATVIVGNMLEGAHVEPATVDLSKVNEELAKLPDHPDEELR